MGIRVLFVAIAIVTSQVPFPASGQVPAPAAPVDAAPDDGDVRDVAQEEIKPARPVPVEFDGQTLFYVRSSVGPRSAEDRARAIEARIEQVARSGEPLQPVQVVEGHESDLFLGNRFIASITIGESGRMENRAFYARSVARRIDESLAQYRAARTPEALLAAGGKVLAATAVLVVFLLLLRVIRARVAPRLGRWVVKALSRLHVQRFTLFDAAAQERFVRVLGRTIHAVVVLLAVVAWLEAVARFLPWSRGPAERALRFSLSAAWGVLVGVIGYLPNLVYIVLFIVVGWGVHALNRLFFRAVGAGAITLPGFYADWAATTSRLVSFAVFALVAVAVYPYLPGSGSSAFQAIGLLLGATISLGSGSAVANAISGLVITYMRPFAVGDFVRIADATGTVTHQGMLSVRLLTIRNEEITLPASTVLAGQILNFSARARTEGFAIRTGVTIGYDTPWRKVEAMLLEAARTTPGVLATPEPWVIQRELSDFFVAYEVDAYVDVPARQHFVLSALNQRVQDVFFKNGVEILSPHWAQIRDGSHPAIPPGDVPAGSEGRPFPVELRGKPG